MFKFVAGLIVGLLVAMLIAEPMYGPTEGDTSSGYVSYQTFTVAERECGSSGVEKLAISQVYGIDNMMHITAICNNAQRRNLQ